MALLDQFTTIGGKHPLIYEQIIDLRDSNYYINDEPFILHNDIDLFTTYNSFIQTLDEGIYKFRYYTNSHNGRDIVEEMILFLTKNQGNDGDFNAYIISSDYSSAIAKYTYIYDSDEGRLDPILTSNEVNNLINAYMNGQAISDFERKNQAYTVEINSQQDFNNTFLNNNWTPPNNTYVKFNCSVEANEHNVVIPNNVVKIEGNNNTISQIKSFGYNYLSLSHNYNIKNLLLINDSNDNLISDPFKGFINCNNLINCNVICKFGNAYELNPGTGFNNCNYLLNCKVEASFKESSNVNPNQNMINYGFYNCFNLINCEDYHYGGVSYKKGFQECSNLVNCTGHGLASSCEYIFSNCKTLINCTVDDHNANVFSSSFYKCEKMYNCGTTSRHINDSVDFANSSIFNNCVDLNNCYISNETVLYIFNRTKC